MPTSTAVIIATVVASIGVLSGAIMSNTNSSNTPEPVVADIGEHHHHDHGQSAEDLNKHYRKPGADAALLSASSYSLEKNTAQQLPLVLEVPPVAGIMRVEIKADEPLNINGKKQFEFKTGEQRKVEFMVDVIAQQDGEFPIHIFTHFIDEFGNTSARAMAVAAKVGNVNSLILHAKNQAQVLPPVEFIKLPGEETIR